MPWGHPSFPPLQNMSHCPQPTYFHVAAAECWNYPLLMGEESWDNFVTEGGLGRRKLNSISTHLQPVTTLPVCLVLVDVLPDSLLVI